MYCIKKENNNNQQYFFDEKIKNRDLLKIKNNVIIQGNKKSLKLISEGWEKVIVKMNKNDISFWSLQYILRF